VLRDATQLTGSVTYDVFGEIPQVRIDSPLFDPQPGLNVTVGRAAAVLQWKVHDRLAGGWFLPARRAPLPDRTCRRRDTMLSMPLPEHGQDARRNAGV